MGDENKRQKKVERVMVHCRVRPLSDDDIRVYGKDTIMEIVDPNKSIIALKREFDRKSFIFDSVFDTNSIQKDVYAKIAEPVVTSVLQGYNGTIFAYGQTGTGKTFTMIGSSGENRGVIPRSAMQIFSHVQQSTTHSYQVKVGFLQLYMEMLQDLLSPDENKVIRIREDPDEGVYLTGISWATVNNVKQCMDLLSVGDRNRSTAFTSMNAHSSRSHAVYMVKIEKRVKYTAEQLEELEKKGEMPDQSMTKSTLYLVDLAGSERVKKSRASGNRLDEAKNINLALLALGNCIQALSDKKAKYVPFRDSKLTRLLEDSLGGNSKTSLIVTIGPSTGHIQESLSALQFGLRAMKIENRPELNIKVDYRSLCAQLQSELDKVNDGSNMFNIEKEQFSEEINSLRAQVERLTAEKEQMEALLEEYRKGHADLGQQEERKKAEIQKLQNNFKLKMEKKENEHKKLLDEIDRHMADQEKEAKTQKNMIIELKNEKKMLNNELKQLQEELEQEKADRQLRATQLITEIDELKQKLLAEKTLNQELQQAKTGVSESIKAKNSQIQELIENTEYLKAQHTTECENLAKEVQKYQVAIEKYKQQLTSKAQEYKEYTEKAEKAWQSSLTSKDKAYSDKISELEKKINSLSLSLTQSEREKKSFQEDVYVEKENVQAQVTKCEKLKENYEDRILKLTEEIIGMEKKFAESGELCDKLGKELESEKKSRKDESEKALEELKEQKKKSAKVLKAYKDLEARAEAASKELEAKLSWKTEEFSKFKESSTQEKDELLKELEEAHKQIASLNKDRSKLISKVENLSKKTSSIVKIKEKLSSEVEVKQQEFKSLMDQREALEEENETVKGRIQDLENMLKNKEASIEELKSNVGNLSYECQKRDVEAETLRKRISDIEKIINAKDDKLNKANDRNNELVGENEKTKTAYQMCQGDYEKALKDKKELTAEVKKSKEACDKTLKELQKAVDTQKNLDFEYKENLQNLNSQKEQALIKLQALSQDYKSLEIQNSQTQSELSAKISEALSAKQLLLKLSKSLSTTFTTLQEKALKNLLQKISILSKNHEKLVRAIAKVKETIKHKSSMIEKVNNANKKEVLLLNEAHQKEITSLKAIHKDVIDNLEDKNSSEIQELQSYYEDILRKGASKNEKAQEELKAFYTSQIEHLNSTHTSQIEDLKNTQSTLVGEIRNSYSTQITQIKEDMMGKIAQLEFELKKAQTKHLEEINRVNRDWEGKMEQTKTFDEETFNSMIKSKQKEIEQLMKENKHLRNEFESTLDRQKVHSSVMKNHQMGLIEEINASHQQELESLTNDMETRIKRKETELQDTKRKLKEMTFANDEIQKDLEDKEGLLEKYKSDLKKAEAESRKLDSAKNSLEENLKILNKKFEFEKAKNFEQENSVSELQERVNKLQEEKIQSLQDLKDTKIIAKKTEDELVNRYKEDKSRLETQLATIKSSSSDATYKFEANFVVQKLIYEVEKLEFRTAIQILQNKIQKITQEKDQITQEFHINKSLADTQIKEDFSYISFLVVEKCTLNLEINSLIEARDTKDQKLATIGEIVQGDYEVVSFLKSFLKSHKKGSNLFDFLTLLASFYGKITEKLPEAGTMQAFSLAKIVHEKYMSLAKTMAAKVPKAKKAYEKPGIDIEKELGISGNLKGESQQEALAKRAREAERSIQTAVGSLVEHILLILEVQEKSSDPRALLDERKKSAEPLFPIELLKSLEIVGIPKNTQFNTSTPELSHIKELKNLSFHLSSLLSIVSALYSCMLSRTIYLEHLVDDRGDLISMLLKNLHLPRKKLLGRPLKLTIPRYFSKDQAAKIIQGYYRKYRKRPTKLSLKMPEAPEEKVISIQKTPKASFEPKNFSNINHKTGLQVIKNHFREVNSAFGSICKKFVKPQNDL